jgi:hypothetical protein
MRSSKGCGICRARELERWASPPWVDLQELEPARVNALEAALATNLEHLRTEGRARGWEID